MTAARLVRDHGSPERLVAGLEAMPDAEREQMRQAGQDFLRSEAASRFGAERWADTLLAHLYGGDGS